MTRCKFTCVSVTKRKSWAGSNTEFHYDAEFNAVTPNAPGKDREDSEDFWVATPGGSIKVATIRNDVFEVGCDYYVDLTPC